ncbi:MAG: Uma2 family endonuclease [Bacteroidetes bacterium]|nr:MAG: Uma2 family endonuclease [Bacteroidota bacterium]
MAVTHLSQLDLEKAYSYADYLTWQLQERLELLRGKIALMSPAPNLYHQKIVGKLHIFVGQFLLHRSCQVFVAPFDVRLPRQQQDSDEETFTVVQPDICVVCDEGKLDERGCKGAPDLVIEVLSPGNTRREMRDKFTLYEEAGVREYWLVDPANRVISRFLLDETGTFIGKRPLTDQEILETELLPGLQIELAEVFA